MLMTLDPQILARYLIKYVDSYRAYYNSFTSPFPKGAGYPKLQISPYLYSKHIHAYLAKDGVVIADYSYEPYEWYLAGGPAIIVDFPETRKPSEIAALQQQLGFIGKNIGHYRIVNKSIPQYIWEENLDDTIWELNEEDKFGVFYHIKVYDLSLEEFIKRLTFGAFCHILDIHLRSSNTSFWMPLTIRNLGFMTADHKGKRFFHYLEFYTHVDSGAWDVRNINVRVQADIRRDFVSTITYEEESKTGATINFNVLDKPVISENFYDRLSRLEKVIIEFEKLLNEKEEDNEAIFHNFLLKYSILLDAYGNAVSKPRFIYPEGASPYSKKYVEPDFIIKYPGRKYKLIELERPSKKMATRSGQPRSEVTQASFQIAEWKTYIQKHYELIKEEFPSISTNYSTMLVISRSSEKNYGERNNFQSQMEIIRNQFAVDEVVTYDDLLNRAKNALIQLSNISQF